MQQPDNAESTLMHALEALGYTEDTDGDYVHKTLPYVRFYDDHAGLYRPYDDEREHMDYGDIIPRLWPYRVREAIAAHLRASIDGIAIDGKVIPVNELIDVMGDL